MTRGKAQPGRTVRNEQPRALAGESTGQTAEEARPGRHFTSGMPGRAQQLERSQHFSDQEVQVGTKGRFHRTPTSPAEAKAYTTKWRQGAG